MNARKRLAVLLVLVVALFVTMFLLGCEGEVSVSTANFKDLQSASTINDDNTPKDVTNIFNPDSPIIYITGIVKNAPDGTDIMATWIYSESDFVIAEISLDLTHINENFKFSLSRPDNGFPEGKYEVKLWIGEKYKESVYFTVQ